MKRKIQLGQKVKDQLTGFTGIVYGHAEYLTGCDQVLVIPKSKPDEMKNGEWIDESRLTIIGKGVDPKIFKGEIPGGPSKGPSRK